jgi:hypothetical protein
MKGKKMREWLIKKLGCYTKDEYLDALNKDAIEVIRLKLALDRKEDLLNSYYKKGLIYKNFFLDTIQGNNRDEYGKFTSRDSLKEYFAWCHIYGQMPHKKLTNAFMRYEASLRKVKSVKSTGEA